MENGWEAVLPEFLRRFSARPLALCDGTVEEAPNCGRPDAEQAELQRVRAARPLLLQKCSADDMSLDQLVREGLTAAEQSFVIKKVFSCLSGASANATRRPGPVRVLGSRRPRQPFRWRARRSLRPPPLASESDHVMSADEVAREIEEKLLRHQRRFYEHLVRRYELSAEKKLQMPGGRAVTCEAVAQARQAMESTMANLATHTPPKRSHDMDEKTPEGKAKRPRIDSEDQVLGPQDVFHDTVAEAPKPKAKSQDGRQSQAEQKPAMAPKPKTKSQEREVLEGTGREMDPRQAPTALKAEAAAVTKQADMMESQAKHRAPPIGRLSLEAESQDQSLEGDSSEDSACSDEEEERPAVDSDEEINNQGEEIQLEDGEEERQNTKRLRSKTSPLVLLDFPVPKYLDYPDDAWPAVWKGHAAPEPGEKGFNEYALSSISQVLNFWENGNLRDSHQVYQQTPLACAHPLAPCKRLLVDARMGAGKTKVLISILDAHFEDRRKKLPIFPTKALVDGFMDEILRWPNKYRSYFALMQPELAARAVPLPATLTMEELREALQSHEGCEWKVPAGQASDLRRRLQTELEMTNVRRETGQKVCTVSRGHLTRTFRQWFQMTHPEKLHLLPGAPLRAMNLTTAGGSFSAKRPNGEARHPVAQFMYSLATQNCFDNSIVIVDEFHHLVNHFCSSKVKLLPRQLMTATNLTLVGLTGTPLPDNPKIAPEGLPAHLSHQRSRLEALLLGRHPKLLKVLVTLSAFSGVPVYMVDFWFSKGLQRQQADERCLEGHVTSYHGPLPGASPQLLGGTAAEVCEAALQSCVPLTAIMAARYTKKVAERKDDRTLQAYTNLEVAVGHMRQPMFECRALNCPEQYASKLHHLATYMRDRSRCKTVILIRKNTGYDFFLKLLRNMCGALFGIATLDQKAEFNCRRTNLRGEQFRVLVAEALEAGEGCSFLNVREQWLVDVPLTATEFEQYKSRVDRADSHAGLPPGERTVQVRLICSSLPEGLGNNFLGSYFWRSATRSTTTLPPAGWQKILDKARRAADCAEKHLDLDPADADCLADMRANLEDDDTSDSSSAEPHSSVQKVKKTFAKLRFDRSVSQITHACAKRLAVETIDQKACRVLAKRCRLVSVAHEKLKAIAMDRPVIQQLGHN
ncbi:unnamed protein product [Durusdinium trenchii]|uniref:Helicase ATP-binding domain-containing protein n=1 Tax=Durusdinium trenchii TaxID=1381693 RepID=A0ABP0M0K7_9DINO